MSWAPSATCWIPSPLYWRRYSSIWLLSSRDSLIGMRILPQGLVSAREIRPVSLPSMLKKRISRKLNSLPYQSAQCCMRVALARPVEVDIPDGALRAVAVDEIEERSADPLDRRDRELVGADLAGE